MGPYDSSLTTEAPSPVLSHCSFLVQHMGPPTPHPSLQASASPPQAQSPSQPALPIHQPLFAPPPSLPSLPLPPLASLPPSFTQRHRQFLAIWLYYSNSPQIYDHNAAEKLSGAPRHGPWLKDTSAMKATLWKPRTEVSPAIFLVKTVVAVTQGALCCQASCSFLSSEKACALGGEAHSAPPGWVLNKY